MEREKNAKNDPSPATNAAFNEVRDFEGKMQDGKGGGNPKDCAFLEKEEKGQNSKSFWVRKEGKRDPPLEGKIKVSLVDSGIKVGLGSSFTRCQNRM